MKRTLLDVSAGAGETEPTTQAEAAETDAVPASPPPPLGLGDVIGISEMYDEIFEHRSDLPTQVALSFVNKACRAAFANRILPRVRARAAAAAAVGDRVQTTPDLYLVHYLLETTVAAPRRYSALFRYFVEHVVGGGLNAHLLATRLLGAGVVLAALADAGLTDDLLWFVDRIEPALARKALVFYKFAARLPTRADMERVYAHLNEPFDRDALLTGPALYYMIEGGHTDTVRWLFEEKRRHHADAREMNEMKRLAFVWAVEFGRVALVKWFLHRRQGNVTRVGDDQWDESLPDEDGDPDSCGLFFPAPTLSIYGRTPDTAAVIECLHLCAKRGMLPPLDSVVLGRMVRRQSRHGDLTFFRRLFEAAYGLYGGQEPTRSMIEPTAVVELMRYCTADDTPAPATVRAWARRDDVRKSFLCCAVETGRVEPCVALGAYMDVDAAVRTKAAVFNTAVVFSRDGHLLTWLRERQCAISHRPEYYMTRLFLKSWTWQSPSQWAALETFLAGVDNEDIQDEVAGAHPAVVAYLIDRGRLDPSELLCAFSSREPVSSVRVLLAHLPAVPTAFVEYCCRLPDDLHMDIGPALDCCVAQYGRPALVGAFEQYLQTRAENTELPSPLRQWLQAQ